MLGLAALGAPITHFDDAHAGEIMHGDEIGLLELQLGLDVHSPVFVKLCQGPRRRQVRCVEWLRQLVELVNRWAKQHHEPSIGAILFELEEF